MKNVLNVEVSMFNGYNDVSGFTKVNLYEMLTSTKYKERVNQIRMVETKEDRDILKSTMPSFMPAGVFLNREKGAKPIKYSGLMCVDIDFADNQHITNFFSLKEELSNIEHVAYCGLSVSGKGYYILVPIKFPDRYSSHYRSIVADLRGYGIFADKTCSNISRLRVCSYDESAFYRLDAEVYCKLEESVKVSNNKYAFNYTSLGDNKVVELVERICREGIDITGQYHDWFAIGCALANEFGEKGRELFHNLSKQSPKYSQAECDRQFSACLSNNYSYSLGSFYYYCKRNGVNCV